MHDGSVAGCLVDVALNVAAVKSERRRNSEVYGKKRVSLAVLREAEVVVIGKQQRGSGANTSAIRTRFKRDLNLF
jgi:hypothetical protein